MKKNLLIMALVASFFTLSGCAFDDYDYDHVSSSAVGYKIKCSDGPLAGRSGRCANDPAGSSLTIEVQ